MSFGTVPDTFSLNAELIRSVFEHAKPLGHHEDRENLNLGFGFLYYGLVRALRPQHVVVIGSGFGFSVVCLALGLRDNGRGRLTFIDPSFSLLKDGPFKTIGGRDNWSDPARARARFAEFGVEDIVTHHCLTAGEFFSRWGEHELPPIDLGFVDGNHAYQHVRNDFINVLRQSKRNSYILLHDTNIYVREMVGHAGVKKWLNRIRRERDAFEAIDFPFASGLAMVRVVEPNAWKQLSQAAAPISVSASSPSAASASPST